MNKPLRTPKTDKPTKSDKATDTRTTRFEMRLSPYVRKVIEHAAAIQGRSMSDFVVTAAEQAAEKAIRNAHIIELTLEDQRLFAETFLNPPKPSAEWRRAIESHRRLIRESR